MNGQDQQFFIKEDCSPELEMLQYMHPAIVNMITWTNFWCFSRGIRPVWTSWMRTKEENKALGATNVHLSRGADISCLTKHGWSSAKKNQFKVEFNRVWKRCGAYTYNSAGKLIRIAIIEHDNGNGNHFHLQCNPNAKVYHTGDVNMKRRTIKVHEEEIT